MANFIFTGFMLHVNNTFTAPATLILIYSKFSRLEIILSVSKYTDIVMIKC